MRNNNSYFICAGMFVDIGKSLLTKSVQVDLLIGREQLVNIGQVLPEVYPVMARKFFAQNFQGLGQPEIIEHNRAQIS